MAKRDQPKKRAALIEQFGKKNLTIGELRQLLATYPDDWPVTGYNGQEETDFVTPHGVEARHSRGGYFGLRREDGSEYVGPYLGIMGF